MSLEKPLDPTVFTIPLESLRSAVSGDSGVVRWRAVPLVPDGEAYWTAAARILKAGGRPVEAAVALAGPDGRTRRLAGVEEGLVAGRIASADAVHDAVSALLSQEEDSDPGRSFLAGWACADVVGRCMADGADE